MKCVSEFDSFQSSARATKLLGLGCELSRIAADMYETSPRCHGVSYQLLKQQVSLRGPLTTQGNQIEHQQLSSFQKLEY